MANNRLFIVDSETNEKFLLAKSMGMGWYIKNPEFVKDLGKWLAERDLGASHGDEITRLILRCEDDIDEVL